ncbi:MAG: nucleotidyltransferase domain-containing protein [Desulfotomaculales bacterium]
MDEAVLSRLKTFSPRHRRYLAAVLREIVAHYGESLLGLAVFGSYARGENRLNSDLDLLIVLDHAPGPGRRLREFVEEVEMKHEALAQELYEREDLSCELSPYILTRREALKLHPIYYDLAEHCLVICDRESLIARIVEGTRKFLERSGARKTPHGNTWGWSLQKPCFPGGIDL